MIAKLETYQLKLLFPSNIDITLHVISFWVWPFFTLDREKVHAHTGKDHIRRHKQIAVCKPRRETSEETRNFYLRLPDSRTVRNLLFKLSW